MPGPATARVVVLLEGRSDVATLRVLARARGLPTDHPDLHLVDMGGATNIRRHLRLRRETAPRAEVFGLCDAAETDFFLRAWRDEGRPVACPADLARLGFHVCQDDLEDELIRALGPRGALGVVHELGLAERFETFTRQPAWQDRPLPDQLHRFAGTASGRKATLDAALARVLSPDAVPRPLRLLLDQVEAAWGAVQESG